MSYPVALVTGLLIATLFIYMSIHGGPDSHA